MRKISSKKLISIFVALSLTISLFSTLFFMTTASGADANPRIANVLYPSGERSTNQLGGIHTNHLDPTKCNANEYRGPAAKITFPANQVADAWGGGYDVVWGKYFMVDGIAATGSYTYGGWIPVQGGQWGFDASNQATKDMIFELDNSYYIDQVSLYGAVEDNAERRFFPQEYKVYTSANGTAWDLQATVNHTTQFRPAPGAGETIAFDNGAVNTKWVRIEFLRNDIDAGHPNDKVIALGEVRISGFAKNPNADYPETPGTPNANDKNVLFPNGERTKDQLGGIHTNHLDPTKCNANEYRGPAANITFPKNQVADAWGGGYDVSWGKYFMVDGIASASEYTYGGWIPVQGAQWGFDKADQATKDMIFELPQQYVIDGISMYAAAEGNVERLFYPQEFKVYTSDNGTNWTMQVYKNYSTQFRPAAGAENRYNFASAVKTKWIRIEFLRNDIDAVHPNDKVIALGEVKIWGVTEAASSSEVSSSTSSSTSSDTSSSTSSTPEKPKGIVNLNYPYGHPYADKILEVNHIPAEFTPAKPNAKITYPTGMFNYYWDWLEDYMFDGLTYFEVEGEKLYPWYDNSSYKRALGAQWGLDPGVQGDTLIIEYPENYKVTSYSFNAAAAIFDEPSNLNPDRLFFPQEWKVYASTTGADGSWTEIHHQNYEEDFIPEFGQEIKFDLAKPVVAKFIKVEFMRAHEAANGDYNIALGEVSVFGEMDASNVSTGTSSNTTSNSTSTSKDDSKNPSTGDSIIYALITVLALTSGAVLTVYTYKKRSLN